MVFFQEFPENFEFFGFYGFDSVFSISSEIEERSTFSSGDQF